MPIAKINQDQCDGCEICVDHCPNDVIRLDDAGKASIAYPEDCHTCFLCETDCPQGLVTVSAVIPDTPVPY